MSPKPQAVLRITPELVISIIRGLTPGDDLRRFVVSNAIPSSAELIEVRYDGTDVLCILEDDSFTDGEVLRAPVIECVTWHCETG